MFRIRVRVIDFQVSGSIDFGLIWTDVDFIEVASDFRG